jgi:FkbM family methyltransferase
MNRPSANEPELLDDPENCVFNRLLQSADPVVVYGAGYCAESIGTAMLEAGRPVDAYCVDDEFHVPGRFVCGKPVQRFSTCLNSFNKATVAVGFGTAHPNWGKLRNHPNVRAIYGNIGLARGLPFDADYLARNWTDLCRLYTRLEDDISRHSLSDYLNSRLFGHTEDLPRRTNPPDTFCDPVLGCSSNEIYCDCGAYDGDTIRRFLSQTTSYNKIYAWEPDRQNAKRLEDFVRSQNLDRIKVIECCAGKEPGFAHFASSGTSVSTIATSGDKVPVDTIDARCPDTTLLKIDIEGEEADALQGAAVTLSTNQTKIIVAVYHRREDLTNLSAIATYFRPASRIMLRWHRTTADDVMMYVV